MKYTVTVNGKTYVADVEKLVPGAVPAPVAAPAAAAPIAPTAPTAAIGETPVNSPMPGTILGIAVAEGQSVKAGQVLCTLEAMKMENEIVAPVDATVKRVAVAKGSSVDTNTLLVVLG